MTARRRPRRIASVEPRSHWLVLVLLLAMLVAALLINGIVHDEAPTGTAGPASDRPAPPAVADLGPVIDARTEPVQSSRPRRGVVALTFDDGPDPTWTPQILAALERHGVPATFFVLGSHVAQHPELARQIVDSGSEIGVHTFTHVDLGLVPSLRAQAELSQTQLAIAGAAGVRTGLMRPPFAAGSDGLNDQDYAAVLDAADDGYLAVLATHDTEDWALPGVDAIVQRATPKDGEGAIVLMHDGGGNRRQTAAALDQLIPKLKDQGYEFATVSDAIGQPSPVVAAASSEQWQGRFLLTAVRASELAVTTLAWALAVLGALTVGRLILVLIVADLHARSRRRPRPRPEVAEPVSVVIPAYNEAAGIARTVSSVFHSTYPMLEIIVVDDGSTDDTAREVERLGLTGVRVIRQPNRGKPAAIQAGVAAARADLLVLLDGDTVFEPDTVTRLVQPFADPRVGAVAGNAKVGNRRGLLGKWQHIEYVIGFNLDRRLYDVLGCMPTVPGAVGAFRRQALADVGGASADTLAEDTDLTMSVVRADWRVLYEENARGWTEAPATFGELWRQRYRWCYGTLQAMWKHKGALFQGGGAGRLGRRGLIYVGLFHVLLPLLGPVLDIFAVYGLLFRDGTQAAVMWAAFLAMQLVIGVVAFRLDRESMRPLLWLPLQQFVYRQMMYLVVIQSVVTAVGGVTLRWHKLERRGDVTVAVGR